MLLPAVFDLRSVLSDIQRIGDRHAQLSGLEFKVLLEDDVPVFVYADRIRVTQVWALSRSLSVSVCFCLVCVSLLRVCGLSLPCSLSLSRALSFDFDRSCLCCSPLSLAHLHVC